MDIHRHPELLDRLAAAYAIGTLRGAARRRFEALARERAPIRAAALIWQSRVASLTELEQQAQPSPTVWTRIQNLVRIERSQAAMLAAAGKQKSNHTMLAAWWRSLALWRGATGVGALAALLAVVSAVGLQNQLGTQIDVLQAQLSMQPAIEYVAVLNDDKASASMLVTFDPKSKKLTLQRVGGYQEAKDKSLQLWALPSDGKPRSLGVLSQQSLLQLAAADSDVKQVPALAISLEPKGGVPSQTGPTGPVLFKGALIKKML
jgi:anti-sigma-K factor RskA